MKTWDIESIAAPDLRDAIRRRIGYTPDDTYGWRNRDGEPCVPHDPTGDLETALAELQRQGATHCGVTASPLGWHGVALRGAESFHSYARTPKMAALKILVQMTEPTP